MSSFSSYTRSRISAYRPPSGSLVCEGKISRRGEGARIVPLRGLGAFYAESMSSAPASAKGGGQLLPSSSDEERYVSTSILIADSAESSTTAVGSR